MLETVEIAVIQNWKAYYYKCTRFEGMKLDWDNNPAFSLVDAMGIGHTILMLPMRMLLKALDMLQPVAVYFNVDCSSGRSGDWMLGSALLWVLIVSIALQLVGSKRVRKSREEPTQMTA